MPGKGGQTAQLNAKLNMRSGNTRATNISSDEHLSPFVANVTDRGLSAVSPDERPKQDNSMITFQSL